MKNKENTIARQLVKIENIKANIERTKIKLSQDELRLSKAIKAIGV